MLQYNSLLNDFYLSIKILFKTKIKFNLHDKLEIYFIIKFINKNILNSSFCSINICKLIFLLLLFFLLKNKFYIDFNYLNWSFVDFSNYLSGEIKIITWLNKIFFIHFFYIQIPSWYYLFLCINNVFCQKYRYILSNSQAIKINFIKNIFVRYNQKLNPVICCVNRNQFHLYIIFSIFIVIIH